MPSRAPAAAPFDPYAVLGVPRCATDGEIKRTYHELARQLHPDKDRSVPTEVATAQFQRVRAAYELLSDALRRRALDASVVTAPFQPAPCGPQQRPSEPRPARPAAQDPSQGRKHPRPERSSPSGASSWPGRSNASAGQKTRQCASTCRDALLVLDSEEEREEQSRRDEEWEAAESVRREHARRRLRRAEEQARRLQEREARHGHEGTGAGCDESSVPLSYARLGLRASCKMRKGLAGEAVTAAGLQAAFADFGARVVKLDADSAILAVAGESRALGCALAFHGWTERPHDEAMRAVYRQVRVVVAPVSVSGRALAGPAPTVAATRQRVVACDGEGAGLL